MNAISKPTRQCQWGWNLVLLIGFLSLGSQGCNYRWNDTDLDEVRSELTGRVGLESRTEEPNAPQTVGKEQSAVLDPPKEDDELSASVEPGPWIDTNSLPNLQWEIIYLGNQPVGYTRRSIEIATEEQLQGVGGIEGMDPARLGALISIEAESRIRISRKTGDPVDQKVLIKTIESLDGQLLGIAGRLDTGVTDRHFRGSVRDGALTIEQTEDKVISKIAVPWDPSMRGPFAIEQSLRAKPMELKEIRTIRYLDPFQIGITETRLEAIAHAEMVDFEGQIKNHMEIENRSVSRSGASNSLMWTDQLGVIRKTYTPGIDRQTYDCDPVTARYVISKEEFDATIFKSLPLLGTYAKISETGFSVFRVASDLLVDEGCISNRTNQTPFRINDRTWDIEVSETGIGVDPSSDSPQRSHLASAGVIDWKNPVVARWVQTQESSDSQDSYADIEPRGVQTAEIAEKIRRRASTVRKWISKAITQTELDRTLQTPALTIRQRKGDCLDHALMLTAVLRSLEIPARIAMGFRAEPSTVRPTCQLHFWVEYYDSSHWIPIDSYIESDLVPSDRFKITESAFPSINAYEPLLGVVRLMSNIEIAARTKRP